MTIDLPERLMLRRAVAIIRREASILRASCRQGGGGANWSCTECAGQECASRICHEEMQSVAQALAKMAKTDANPKRGTS